MKVSLSSAGWNTVECTHIPGKGASFHKTQDQPSAQGKADSDDASHKPSSDPNHSFAPLPVSVLLWTYYDKGASRPQHADSLP